MPDKKEQLKQLVDAIINNNDEAAEVAFHSFAEDKMKSILGREVPEAPAVEVPEVPPVDTVVPEGPASLDVPLVPAVAPEEEPTE